MTSRLLVSNSLPSQLSFIDIHSYSAMKRKQVDPPGWHMESSAPICPLCARPIPTAQRDAHHLIPKMKGGKLTVTMHRICHRHIHALFTETELARDFNTAEALLQQAEIQKFVRWVQTKPDDFFERTRRAGRRR
ncbi:5-methylcytosine-specific restriction endonuclease McrA [Undibacterium sp. GrIS 1.8]|uniref:HNH endonuclease n=1 Tax=unclassified Undibacterium TaxID=2630295 RepID=UPI003390DE47